MTTSRVEEERSNKELRERKSNVIIEIKVCTIVFAYKLLHIFDGIPRVLYISLPLYLFHSNFIASIPDNDNSNVSLSLTHTPMRVDSSLFPTNT